MFVFGTVHWLRVEDSVRKVASRERINPDRRDRATVFPAVV